MSSFLLKIVTPDGLQFEGQAEKLIVRTVSGDVAILARHINFVAPLGMGQAVVVSADGTRRTAACIGGMLSVINGDVDLVPTTFEWADEIDLQRAERAYDRADKIIKDSKSTDTDIQMAEARLRRALVRKSVARMK